MPDHEKHVPSLKSTSGAGFDYEDEVAALFIAEMLAGKPSLLAEWGAAYMLQRQVAALEPHGDIVLWFTGANGEPFRCAVSVKSAPASSTNGFGKDSVADMWTVYLSDAFARNTDTIGLAIPPVGKEFLKRAHDLTNRARRASPATLETSLRGKDEQAVFDSFRHPTDQEMQPGLLLSRLVIRDAFDFEKSVSDARNAAILLCATLLADTEPAEIAQELWTSLVPLAGELRKTGGEATIASVLRELHCRFSLKDSPQDQHLWRRVRGITSDAMAGISTGLPGGAQVLRKTVSGKLSAVIASDRAVAVVGQSGAGKSALVKSWCRADENGAAEIIWLATADITRLEMSPGDFAALMRRSRRSRGILVFDGAENWPTDREFVWAAGVLSQLKQDSRWTTVITCQEQEWDRAERKLTSRLGQPIQAVPCGMFDEAELRELCSQSSVIASLAVHPHLRDVMRLPQMLHVMLETPPHDDAVGASWTCESDVVQWWWQERVCGGRQLAATGSLAKRLAVSLADNLATEVPESAAEGSEEDAQALIKGGVLRRTSFGTLRFAHDLYSDWARVQHLRPLGDALVPFVSEHIENPPWFRSLRVLCQQFLELDNDLAKWRSLIEPILITIRAEGDSYRRPKPDPIAVRMADAALEAIVHCAHAPKYLERLTKDLLNDNCTLFARLIRCMLITSTVPDLVAIYTARLHGKFSEREMEAMSRCGRVPLVHYWLPVLDFIVKHKEKAVSCLPSVLAAIIPMFATYVGYLKEAGYDEPEWWKGLAGVAVDCGRQELQWEIEGVMRFDDGTMFGPNESRAAIYLAALLAASAWPDRVAELALKAAGRVGWDKGDLPSKYREEWGGRYTQGHGAMDFDDDNGDIVQPVESWDDGPRRQTSNDFGSAWLEGGAINLARVRPDAVVEITLGFLLDWPKRRMVRSNTGSLDDQHGFNFLPSHWYPPFWHHGPFFLLLRVNRDAGLALVVKLVNFAAARVADWWPTAHNPNQMLAFDSPVGRVEWSGHSNMFGWCHDSVNTVEAVTCALMALEKWMMDELAQKRAVTEAIHFLFREGRSLAFAGLLISIGKAYPDVLLQDLRPLLNEWRCYCLDQPSDYMGPRAGGWFTDPDIVNQLRREWAQQPHRRRSLGTICSSLIADRPESRGVFLEVANIWRAKAAQLAVDDSDRVPLLRWASDFDFSTWVEVESEDGKRGWRIERPAELCDEKAAENHERGLQLLKIPHWCKDALEQRKAPTAEQAQEWWTVFEQLIGWLDELGVTGNESLRENPQHAVTGVMAAMLCLASEWLAANPDKLDRIESTALSILGKMEPRRVWTARDTSVDCELFMARCAVRLWALRPASKQWRACCGSVTSSFRYGVVGALMDEAYRVRTQIGSGFNDLCQMVLAYAAERGEVAPHFDQEAYESRLRRWREEWWPKFSEGLIPPVGENWGETLGVTAEDLEWHGESAPLSPIKSRRPRGGQRSRFGYGFDVYLVLGAFSCVPASEDDRGCSPHDLDRWRKIDRNLFAALLRTLPAEVRHVRHRAPQIYASDRQILQRAAIRSLTSADSTTAESYWRPLLQKGPNASQFVKDYVADLRIWALKLETDVNLLLPIWHGILACIKGTSKWDNWDEGIGDKLLHEMLFVGRTSEMLGWQVEDYFAPLILALAPHYEAVIRDQSLHYFEFGNFIHFLSGSATRSLLVQVFDWCHDRVCSTTGVYWDDRSLRLAFSQLLEAGWKHSYAAIRVNPRALACFKKVVTALAAAQEPIGLEVQGALGRAT